MTLANQIFYLAIAFISFGLIYPAFLNLKSDSSKNEARYWFLSVLALMVSSIIFTIIPIFKLKILFGIAIAATLAVEVFLLLFFLSLRKSPNPYLVTFLILSIIASYGLGNLEYAYRLTSVMLILGIMCILQLYQLLQIFRKDRSRFVSFMLVLLILQIVLICLRVETGFELIFSSNLSESIPRDRYSESTFELLLRLGIAGLNVLLITGINDYHFEKLWYESREKADRREQQMLNSLYALGKARDIETGRHTLRTQNFVELIAKDLKENYPEYKNLSEQHIHTLFKAAPLHDIGKVGIPDAILQKAGKHTPEEMEIMRTHVAIGESILNASKSFDKNDVINLAISIAASHHERWDGSGYPRKLRGDDIPLEGRIMALADVYDALTTKRPYKRSWTHQEAYEELVKNSGVHFDPKIVDSFKRLHLKFDHLAFKLSDQHAYL